MQVDKNMAQEKELAMLQSFKEKQDAQVKDLKASLQKLGLLVLRSAPLISFGWA